MVSSVVSKARILPIAVWSLIAAPLGSLGPSVPWIIAGLRPHARSNIRFAVSVAWLMLGPRPDLQGKWSEAPRQFFSKDLGRIYSTGSLWKPLIQILLRMRLASHWYHAGRWQGGSLCCHYCTTCSIKYKHLPLVLARSRYPVCKQCYCVHSCYSPCSCCQPGWVNTWACMHPSEMQGVPGRIVISSLLPPLLPQFLPTCGHPPCHCCR